MFYEVCYMWFRYFFFFQDGIWIYVGFSQKLSVGKWLVILQKGSYYWDVIQDVVYLNIILNNYLCVLICLFDFYVILLGNI